MTTFSIIISQGGNASHMEECNNITKIHGQGVTRARIRAPFDGEKNPIPLTT
jgi:hexokinase